MRSRRREYIFGARRTCIAKTSTLLALFAAIMLVIAGVGAPARAEAAICDPCPPDCAMMAQAHQDGPAAPADDRSGGPCDDLLACAATAAAALPPEPAAYSVLSRGAVEHDRLDPRAAPSRPPDPPLRPPIQL